MPNYTLHYFNGRGRAEVIRMMFHMAGVKYMDKRIEFSDWDRCRNDFPCNYLPCLQMDNGNMMPETMAICRYLAREYGFYPRSSMDMMRCDYICDCFYEIMHDYMRYYHNKNGRFRYNMMDGGMMGSGMMGSNMSSGMMGSNMGPGMMGSNMGPGMMGSNMGPGMMGSNMGPGMMGSNMGPGMMGSNMSSGMMGSNMSSGMMGSNMGSGMMGSSDMMSCNNDNYMQWRYMNTFNRIMPFMERTLCMKNGGSHYFMGDQMMWCDMMMYCCMENMYMQNQSMFSNYPKLMSLYNRVGGHPKISSYLKSRCNTMW